MLQDTAPSPPPSLWRDLCEAVRGSQQDFTRGSLGRATLLLAVPMVLEMAMESLFAVCDVFFVARLGATAVAAVGLTESILTLVFGVAIGLGMATTALVARRIGEQDTAGAAVTAVQALGLGVVLAVPMGIAGAWFAPMLLGVMGAPPEVIAAGSGYAALVLGGNLSVVLLFLGNAVFRGAGDAAFAMRALWLANACNILLDPLLIFGWGPFPEMGVTGAAVATVIGRSVGVLYQLSVFLRGLGRVRIRRGHWRFESTVIARLLRISLGGILQFLVASGSWMALTRLVAVFGSAAVAGYTIAVRIIVFSLLPSWGMGNAAATLVGQNLGAAQPRRAEKAVWVAGFWNVLLLVSMAVVFITGAERVVRWFTAEAAVAPFAVDCLRYFSYGYAFYAYGMVVVQAFNGAGDTFTPTLINLGCYWGLQIPLAWLLALPLAMGPRGVFLAITISESLLAVVSVIWFRRRRWQSRRV